MSEYRKTIVAVVGAVVAILAATGIDIDPTIPAAVISLATALLVYLVPNDSEVELEDLERERL